MFSYRISQELGLPVIVWRKRSKLSQMPFITFVRRIRNSNGMFMDFCCTITNIMIFGIKMPDYSLLVIAIV